MSVCERLGVCTFAAAGPPAVQQARGSVTLFAHTTNVPAVFRAATVVVVFILDLYQPPPFLFLKIFLK